MISAHTRRSIRELTRRKARSALTILTIVVAIAGIWLFAIPGNIDASLTRRAQADGLHSVRLAPEALNREQVPALRAIPNVANLDVRTLGGTEMLVNGRAQWVWLIGVQDYQNQSVNIVSVDEGALPAASRELVTDYENLRTGRYKGLVGDSLALKSAAGPWVDYQVTGRGGTLRYSSTVADDAPILYLNNLDVRELLARDTFNSIDVVAADRSPEAVAPMVERLRSTLATQSPNLAYWDVLEVWEAGDWPGREDFDNLLVLFWIIGGVAMLSALVLIFTTMNTIVREQTREIGMMKAVGGTRGMIGSGYLRTALILGGIGTVLGIALGIPLSNLVAGYMSSEFGGTSIGFELSLVALALSIGVGLGGTVLAAWPALHRASRITVREAIDDHGVAGSYGLKPVERSIRKASFLSRRVQIGLRNATRRFGRSLATAIPIGLAVGTMLAFGTVAITALDESRNSTTQEGGDITVWNNGGRGLGIEAGSLIETVPQVEFAHQMIYSSVELDGEKNVWGLPAVSTYDHDIITGRWFTEAEAESAASVVVFGEALANLTKTEVGEVVTVETRRGPIELEVVGIDGHLVNDGQGMFMPFHTVLDYEGWTTGNYWVRTVAPDEATVDTADAAIQRVLRQNGYRVGSSLQYVTQNQNAADDRLVVTVIMAMGLPIVAIGMIGLVSSMSSNILDRTREIGILRSLGARRRDVRGIFRVEGVTIAVAGWLIGIPIGYALGRLIMWVLENEFHASFGYDFPLWTVLVALAVTVLVSIIVLRIPLRKAVRMQPGDALRYE